MNLIKHILESWAAAILAATLVLGWGWLTEWAGKLEGWSYPVVSGVTLETIEKYGDYSSKIAGQFDIIRDCDFRSIKWYVGTEQNHTDVIHEFIEGSKKRQEGNHTFGPWLVSVNPDEILRNVFADVYHECHGVFDTITRFYPQDIAPQHMDF